MKIKIYFVSGHVATIDDITQENYEGLKSIMAVKGIFAIENATINMLHVEQIEIIERGC